VTEVRLAAEAAGQVSLDRVLRHVQCYGTSIVFARVSAPDEGEAAMFSRDKGLSGEMADRSLDSADHLATTDRREGQYMSHLLTPALLPLLIAPQSEAWGPEGHKAIAKAAQGGLTPGGRQTGGDLVLNLAVALFLTTHIHRGI